MRLYLYFESKSETEVIDYEQTSMEDTEILKFEVFSLFEKNEDLKKIITSVFNPVDSSDGFPTLVPDAYSAEFDKILEDTIEVTIKIHFKEAENWSSGNITETLWYRALEEGFEYVNSREGKYSTDFQF